MDTGITLLPEPFSEKNIDGSPISKSQEGRGLFRNSPKAERRVSDGRSGMDRRASSSGGPVDTPYGSSAGSSYGSSLASGSPADASYGGSGASGGFADASYGGSGASGGFADVSYGGSGASGSPAGASYGGSGASGGFAGASYGSSAAPSPVKREETTQYDTERFDPPVDEKPGMIPNPMKMPPVKKKSSLEYDLDDTGYGGYDEIPSNAPGTVSASADEDDGYGYGSSSGSFDSGDYGYGDDSLNTVVLGGDDMDFGYGGYEGSGPEPADIGTDDDYDADYGPAGGYDSDYDTDYGSGSDISDDYY